LRLPDRKSPRIFEQQLGSRRRRDAEIVEAQKRRTLIKGDEGRHAEKEVVPTVPQPISASRLCGGIT
jgi:hypothetical protein